LSLLTIRKFDGNPLMEIDEISPMIVLEENYKNEIKTNDMCSICYEPLIEKNNVIVKTGCGHWFHKNCLHNWFMRNLNCPFCRAILDTNYNSLVKQEITNKGIVRIVGGKSRSRKNKKINRRKSVRRRRTRKV